MLDTKYKIGDILKGRDPKDKNKGSEYNLYVKVVDIKNRGIKERNVYILQFLYHPSKPNEVVELDIIYLDSHNGIKLANKTERLLYG